MGKVRNIGEWNSLDATSGFRAALNFGRTLMSDDVICAKIRKPVSKKEKTRINVIREEISNALLRYDLSIYPVVPYKSIRLNSMSYCLGYLYGMSEIYREVNELYKGYISTFNQTQEPDDYEDFDIMRHVITHIRNHSYAKEIQDKYGIFAYAIIMKGRYLRDIVEEQGVRHHHAHQIRSILDSMKYIRSKHCFAVLNNRRLPKKGMASPSKARPLAIDVTPAGEVVSSKTATIDAMKIPMPGYNARTMTLTIRVNGRNVNLVITDNQTRGILQTIDITNDVGMLDMTNVTIKDGMITIPRVNLDGMVIKAI